MLILKIIWFHKFENAYDLCKSVVHLMLGDCLARRIIYERMHIIHSSKLHFEAKRLLFRLHAYAELCPNDFHFPCIPCC